MATAVRKMVLGGQWSSVTLPSEEATVANWQRRVLGALLRLRRLPQSWDTYGSPQLQQGAQESAADLIALLALHKPPIPHVAPVPGGGVQFEWEFENRALEIEVLADGTVEFLAIDEKGSTAEGSIAETHNQVPRLIHWLKSSDAIVYR